MTLNNWTDELRDRVKVLWCDHSAKEIAAVFGGEGLYVSRNAVVGLVHRMGLNIKHKTEIHPQTNNPGRVRRAPKPRLVSGEPKRQYRRSAPRFDAETIALRCVEIEPLNISLLDLEDHHCRYPFGDEPSLMTSCGHPKMKGSSYCVPHFHLTRGEGTPGERAAHKVAKRMESAA